jgi:hypothetical protein
MEVLLYRITALLECHGCLRVAAIIIFLREELDAAALAY